MIKSGVVSDAAKGSKQLAKQIARQIAQEPLEIVKEVKTQIPTVEKPPQQSSEKSVDNTPQVSETEKAKMKAQTIQRYQDLNAEIQRIVKEKQQKESDLVSQEDYLKNLKEEEKEQSAPIYTPSKPSRKMGGQGAHLEKIQKKSEIRMPPSG